VVTFRYTATGPEGLLKGKKAYVFITRGGIYSNGIETQTPYLKQFLAFIGITEVQFVYAEGLSMGDDVRQQSLNAAHHAIEDLLPHAA
jgi:FMN-dependent NADH-azoreductase